MRKKNISVDWGFTLIELIVVIVIVGILSALGGLMITNHMEGYVATSRRAALVDSAESALRRMERDVQAALPNSINASGNSLTLLHTVGGGRYRTKCPDSSTSCTHNQTLEFNQTDTKFSMIGRLLNNNINEVQNGTVVVYNTGNSPADAYSHTNNASIRGVTASAGPSVGINASSNFTISSREFPNRSPYKRFQIVDSLVCYSYENGSEGGKLWRYQSSDSITDPTASDYDCEELGSGSLIAKHVEDVNFKYNQCPDGRCQSSALLTMNATLSKEDETITLLQQVHVLNYP